MPNSAAAKIIHDALEWNRAYPKATALDILDQAMEGHEDSDPNFEDDTLPDGDQFHPSTPFGQLVAEAFDTGMPPEDWLALTSKSADPRIADALMGVWFDEVTPAFAERFRVWGRGRHASG